jgi:7-cyano-7-deazaguanine synthase
MPNLPTRPTTGLLLSGGIDSAVLLHRLLVRGWRVVPFYVRTGSVWQASELQAIERFSASLNSPDLIDPVVLDMPVDDLYANHWSLTGSHVPDDATPDEAVYLPGHNPLLLIKPALWCQMHGVENLTLATLANNPFRDATPAFFARFEAMLETAMASHLRIARPFEQLTKSQVLEMGHDLRLELTFSCLAPLGGLHCGHCNKCAERRRGFAETAIPDRTPYAAIVSSS